MNYHSALIAVSSIERPRAFYEGLLGQKVLFDFGENVSYGGFSIQERRLWADFLQKREDEVRFGALDAELYFEEDEFDAFLKRLSEAGVLLVAPPVKHPWEQRAVRFFDPDRHIIEVAESMEFVCRRLISEGHTVEETAEISQHPVEFVERALRGGE